MPIEFLAVAVIALAVGPILVDRYLRHLPVAPACPCCRSVARHAEARFSVMDGILFFSRTFLAECARCGWRGRMRWRWAMGRIGPGR